jgi:hypothetical protein
MRTGIRGQALTEFLICASFVLIPLFLIVPMFGKYIEMRLATIEAARYEAWEYSVWYSADCERDMFASFASGGNECPMSGFDAVEQPFKSRAVTQSETRRRFFSRTDAAFTPADPDDPVVGALPVSSADAGGWDPVDANRTWNDHRNLPMYTGGVGPRESLRNAEDTPVIPIIGDVLDILIDVVSVVFGAIGDLMGILGSSVGFDAINTDGYAKATVHMTTATVPVYATLGTMNRRAETSSLHPALTFSAKAGVLTDAWNSGSLEQTYNQAGGVVPSVLLKELLNLPGLNEVWAVVGLLAPELRECHPDIISLFSPDFPHSDKGSLWLGHIDIDAVHPDRLSGGGGHTCNDAGMCDFEPARTPDQRDCIP